MDENNVTRISTRNLAEYIRKAALYDAIINYCIIAKYPSADTILEFAGETVTDNTARDGEDYASN